MNQHQTWDWRSAIRWLDISLSTSRLLYSVLASSCHTITLMIWNNESLAWPGPRGAECRGWRRRWGTWGGAWGAPARWSGARSGRWSCRGTGGARARTGLRQVRGQQTEMRAMITYESAVDHYSDHPHDLHRGLPTSDVLKIRTK